MIGQVLSIANYSKYNSDLPIFGQKNVEQRRTREATDGSPVLLHFRVFPIPFGRNVDRMACYGNLRCRACRANQWPFLSLNSKIHFSRGCWRAVWWLQKT